MDPLFPKLPEGFEGQSREELEAALTERLEIVDKILENKNDPEAHAEFVGERTGKKVMDELTAGVEDIERLKEALRAKADEEKAYAEGIEELAARAVAGLEAEESEEKTAEGDGEEKEGIEVPADGTEAELTVEAEGTVEEEPETETETPAEEPEAEPIVASAAPLKVSRPVPLPSRERRGVPESPEGVGVLRASGGFSDIPAGSVLDRHSLADALITAHESTDARNGARVKTVVASARVKYPQERVLDGDGYANMEKIRAVTSPEVILASGGFCAPYTPIYDLPFISSKARPVKGALAAFQANRGGITYPTPLSVADVADGVGIVLNEWDALGGTYAAKTCVTIDCDEFQSADVDAVYACVVHGNLGARAWPERVANIGDLLDVQHAIVAETNLLDLISTGSTATTDGAVYGAVSSLLQGVLKAASAYRSRHRMGQTARLRVLLPDTVIALMQADMVHGQFDRFHAQAEVERLFGLANVNVSFYMDSPTGAGQQYGAQGAGALADFITTIVWYLFHEGAWLFLDMGRLDLGIIRDSVLTETNDFEMFMETFEGAAMVGVESIEVTSTVCPDGTYAPDATAITCGQPPIG